MPDKTIDTPYKRAVHMILLSIIHNDPKYVLDKKYIRWGKVERDLWDLENENSIGQSQNS